MSVLRGLLVNVNMGPNDWQRIPDSMCLRTRSRICGRNPRTDADATFRDPHTSDPYAATVMTGVLNAFFVPDDYDLDIQTRPSKGRNTSVNLA